MFADKTSQKGSYKSFRGNGLYWFVDALAGKGLRNFWDIVQLWAETYSGVGETSGEHRLFEDNDIHIHHDIIDLSILGKLYSSALTDPDWKVPEGHYEQENMKQTVVPNRNAICFNRVRLCSFYSNKAMSRYL